jgi:hypothetical protein
VAHRIDEWVMPQSNICPVVHGPAGDPACAQWTPPNVPSQPGTFNLFSLDCLSQFLGGYYYVVQRIHSRRYPLVDNERGIVWAHAVFDQGTVNEGVLADGTPHSYRGFNRPSSILVTEAFLIVDRKIHRVEMVGPSAFYHINSPWGGLSGD